MKIQGVTDMCKHWAIVGFALIVALGVSFVSACQQTVAERGGPTPQTPAVAGQVEIEVGLVTKSGNVQRVARTEFQLVKTSVAAVLMDNDPEGLSHWVVSSPEQPHEDLEVSTYCLVRSGGYDKLFANDSQERRAKSRRRLAAVMAAVPTIKTNTVQTVQTGFDGKARFTNVPPWNYWLFGCYSLAPNESAWNVPIVGARGETKSIILDQNNAMGH